MSARLNSVRRLARRLGRSKVDRTLGLSPAGWTVPLPLTQAAALTLLCAAIVLGQADMGVIYGRITDSRGHPQRVTVRLLAAGDISAGDVYTDSEGQYAFESLPSGEYWVVVEAEGYEPVRQSVRLDIHVNSNMQVNVSLEPAATAGVSPSPVIPGSVASQKLDARKQAPVFNPKALREFDKGNASERKGDLHGAIAHFERALEIEPRFYPALNNLGAAFERRGNHQRAEALLMKALEINPDDGESYINLGHVLYEEGRYPAATARLKEGLNRSPASAIGYFFLGSTYLKLGDLAQAESNLKQACKLDPHDMPKAHLQLANVYLRAHNPASAAAELEIYIQASPRDPQVPAIRKLVASIESSKY